jgi:hypothetical protein
MIEKFASNSGEIQSEFLDLNPIRDSMILVSPTIPKFAPDSIIELRRTSASGH